MSQAATATIAHPLAEDVAPQSNVIPFRQPDDRDHESNVTYYGDWPADVRALPIRLSKASDAKSYEWPISDLTTWGEALDNPLTWHEPVRAKGHQGFTQGEVRNGGRRLAPNMVALYCVSGDIESGDTEVDVRKRIQNLRWCALTYSTYSHRQEVTKIANKALMQFLKVDTLAHLTNDDVRRYLIEKRGMRPWVVEQISVAEGDGFERVVSHAPIDRFRVVIPLAVPFVLKDHGETEDRAAAIWAAFYRGVMAKLDVWHDESCEDVTRFMYAPEHPWGRIDYFINVIGGERALSYEEIELIAKEGVGKSAKKAGSSGPRAAPHRIRDLSLPLLRQFWKNYGLRFDAVQFFGDRCDSVTERTGEGGGICCECPDGHSHGNGHAGGFWCAPANAGGMPIARCSHDTHAGFLTEDFIDLAADGDADIHDARDLWEYVLDKAEGETCDIEDNEPFADVEAAKQAANAVPDGDVEQAGRVAYKVGRSNLTPAQIEAVKSLLCGKRIRLSPSAFKAELKRGQGDRPVISDPGTDAPGWCPPELMIEDGSFHTWRLVETPQGKVRNADKFVCRMFKPVARVTDPDGTLRGLRIAHGGREMTVSIESLHTGKEQLAVTLHATHGLECGTTRQAHDALAELMRCALRYDELTTVIEVARPGWHFDGKVFVCANGRVIGSAPNGATVRLADKSGYKERAPDGVGDRATEAAIYARVWREGPVLWRFADLIGLAAPCLDVVGCRSGGFALDGTSRHGKTTAQHLQVARAGCPDEKSGKGGLVPFNPSPEAAEIPLRDATCNPFAMDEMQNVKDLRELQRFIFVMAGGSGKLRMQRTADAMRDTHTWRALTTISTERTIADTLRSVGKAMVGGLVARYPSLSVSGLCDHTPSNGALAEDVERTLFANHGHTFGDFVQRALIGIDRTEAVREWRALQVHLSGTGTHLKAPAEFFALCWWAGVQAARVRLTDGLTAERVADTVRAAWENFAGREEGKALAPGVAEIEALREYIATHRDRTFVETDSSGLDGTYQDRAGYYDGECYYLLASKMDEVTGGTGNRSAVVEALKGAGLLILPKSGRDLTFTSIPHVSGKVRHYRLSRPALDGDDGGNADQFRQASREVGRP